MYHRGGDRDWHHGHYQNQRNGPPPRSHKMRPYRGGYRDHREHSNSSQYNDYSPCQDRNYSDSQFMNNQEHPYRDYSEENRDYHEDSRHYEDSRPYHGYREPRGQGYYRGSRHDNSYQKDFRGGYQQSQAHKKYPYKSPKPYRKEDDTRGRSLTPKPAQTVVHNTSRNIITLTDGSSENVPSKEKSLTQEGANHLQEGSKPVQYVAMAKESNKASAQVTEGGAEPSEEDTELSDENLEHSKEGIGVADKRSNPNDGEKIKKEDVISDFDDQRIEPLCPFTQNTTEMTKQPSCSTECLTDAKKDIHQTQEELPVSITVGKRAHSEDRDFCFTEDDTEEETFFSKRMCTWNDEDQIHMNKTVEIPLLDGWAEGLPDSDETAGTSTQRQPEPAVDLKQPGTAKELRKAFILAKKEEIEMAFSQDCRTFAFVANTLLKKDPSMEVTVTNALRSALQDIAGRCVQELRSFVEQYDSVVVNASNRPQK